MVLFRCSIIFLLTSPNSLLAGFINRHGGLLSFKEMKACCFAIHSIFSPMFSSVHSVPNVQFSPFCPRCSGAKLKTVNFFDVTFDLLTYQTHILSFYQTEQHATVHKHKFKPTSKHYPPTTSREFISRRLPDSSCSKQAFEKAEPP